MLGDEFADSIGDIDAPTPRPIRIEIVTVLRLEGAAEQERDRAVHHAIQGGQLNQAAQLVEHDQPPGGGAVDVGTIGERARQLLGDRHGVAAEQHAVIGAGELVGLASPSDRFAIDRRLGQLRGDRSGPIGCLASHA